MHLDSAVTFRDDDLIACVCGRTRPGRPARAAGRVRGGLTAAAVTGRGFLSFVSRAHKRPSRRKRAAPTSTKQRNRYGIAWPLAPASRPAASPRLDGYQYHEITTHKFGS